MQVKWVATVITVALFQDMSQKIQSVPSLIQLLVYRQIPSLILAIYLSFYLSIYLNIYLSIKLSFYLSIYLSYIYLSICLDWISSRPSTCYHSDVQCTDRTLCSFQCNNLLSIYLSIYLSICLDWISSRPSTCYHSDVQCTDRTMCSFKCNNILFIYLSIYLYIYLSIYLSVQIGSLAAHLPVIIVMCSVLTVLCVAFGVVTFYLFIYLSICLDWISSRPSTSYHSDVQCTDRTLCSFWRSNLLPTGNQSLDILSLGCTDLRCR